MSMPRPGPLRRVWQRLHKGVREGDPRSLFGPERADVRLRVALLQSADAGASRSALRETPYFRFLHSMETWADVRADEQLEGFLALAASIRAHGYLGGEFGAKLIVVARRPRPFETLVPPRPRGQAGRNVDRDTCLVRGAHRLAVLLHLGVPRVRYRLVSRAEWAAPDYTTYLQEHDIELPAGDA